MNDLLEIIEKFKAPKILTLGDMMLDEYCWGKVNRISPEAPIPILEVEKTELRLGGAASSCMNLKALGCEVFPLGVIGDDENGAAMRQIFERNGMDSANLFAIPKFKTTLKKRLLTRQQQLLRMDVEQNKVPDPASFEHFVEERIRQIMPQMDGVLISDYAKGVCTEKVLRLVIDLAKSRNLPIVCDPGKGRDYSVYKGVTTIKPNRAEGQILTQKELKEQNAILEAAQTMQNLTAAEFITLSLDSDGILLYKSEDEYHFIPAQIQEVSDVTGAGDMLVSVLVGLLANGADYQAAAKIANFAASLEVTKLGASPLDWEQIKSHIERRSAPGKMLTLEKIGFHIPPRIHRKKPIVFVNSYFDNFNNSVLKFLLALDNYFGSVVAGVNSDRSILEAKGVMPLLNLDERAQILSNLSSIDWVIPFDEPDAINLLRAIEPDIYVKSAHLADKDFAERKIAEELSVKIEFLPYYQ